MAPTVPAIDFNLWQAAAACPAADICSAVCSCDRVCCGLQLRNGSTAIAAEYGTVLLQKQNQVRKCLEQILGGHERVLSPIRRTVVPRKAQTVTWIS